MESLNIRLYKDGEDLIVVYKNGVKDIDEISKKILSPLNSQDIPVKEIPNLMPILDEEEKPITVKETEEKYENIYPSFTEENDEDVAEENKEEKVLSLNPEEILKKEKFEGFIKLLIAIKSDELDNETKALSIKLVKKYYTANKHNIKDSNRTIKHDELKKLIHISYGLFKEAIDSEINKKGFTDLDMALTTMTQYNVRGLYWNVVVRNIEDTIKSL